MGLSTVRSAFDQTIGEHSDDVPPTLLQEFISSEWVQSGEPNLVTAMRRHPNLLRNRSALLNLAIAEYKSRSTSLTANLEQHCGRFAEFGSSIQRSIFRQLEAQRYIDDHPELLDALYTPPWPKVGDDFGQFTVLEELGFGAMARVYLCIDTELGNREVVVKATPFASFEASLLGRLSHPNIIPIYSAGRVDDLDLYYVCMPFCGRSTLSDLLDIAFQKACPSDATPIAEAATRWTDLGERGTKLSSCRFSAGSRMQSYVGGVLRIAIQIADALQHAHSQQILHGDLKPSNVLLTPDCRPVLLDFNLAQDFKSSEICGGTLPYMAPELLHRVASGNEGNDATLPSITSDIYSFGALLYELVTGRVPAAMSARCSDPATIACDLLARLREGVTPPSAINPYISARVESIILKCLAADKSERFTCISDVKLRLLAELRFFRRVSRTVRVRPCLSFAATIVTLAISASLAGYIAIQPPRYLSDFQCGLEHVKAGDLEKAISSFNSSATANRAFVPARFELARAHLANGDIDLAINAFGDLAHRDHHQGSMAYLGYCFNLKRLPVAAIPWYERAILLGGVSMEVCNNLGASYLDAQSNVSYGERLERAELNLLKALDFDPLSATINTNLIRLAVAKSNTDPTYNPNLVWRQAATLLETSPGKPIIKFHLVAWYSAVQAAEGNISSIASSHAFRNPDDLSVRQQFEKLQALFRPGQGAGFLQSLDKHNSVEHYFLEPASVACPSQ